RPRDAGLALVAVNDTGEPWRVSARAARCGFGGTVLAEHGLELEVPPRGIAEAALPAAVADPGGNARRELLAVTAGDRRCLWFFAPDRELELPAPGFAAVAEPAADGATVTVTARTLLVDLALFPDRLDPAAEVDEQLVTLLPGESTTFRVRSAAPLDPAALVTRPVLRCVNDVLAAGGAPPR